MHVRQLLTSACTGAFLASLVASTTAAQDAPQTPSEGASPQEPEGPPATDGEPPEERSPEPAQEPDSAAPDPADDAPPDQSAEPVDPNRVYAPVLVDFVDAPYPPEAAAERLEGAVVLRLSIDAEGAVTDVQVEAPAGHGFDEAAVEAARQFRFEPARRGSTPVAARILYTYEFQLPPEGTIAGTVLVPDTSSDEAVVGAAVYVEGRDGTRYEARTDAEGKFTIEALPPGNYIVQAQAEGIGRISTNVAVADDQTSQTMLRLLPPDEQNPIEVTVWGETDVEQLRRSAQAVQIVELDEARREASDLGEVLARTEGVNIRRTGGLGSPSTLTINGLTGSQIRIFLDGVPLDLQGFPLDISSVPIPLLERVDIYRGVVPIRFATDALGAAVNLVTEQDLTGTRGALTLQASSFDTQRLTAMARHRQERTGFFVRGLGFFDNTRNDYRIRVEVPDDVGRLSEETVYRFHDNYRAGGGALELGVVDVKWADRFIVRGFGNQFDNDIQHNNVMTQPYGEVNTTTLNTGGSVRYDNTFNDSFGISLIGGYTYNNTAFLDVTGCVFDWFGQCIRERQIEGEIQPGNPRDTVVVDDTYFGRLNFAWRINPNHGLAVAVGPTYVTRTGEDRILPPEAVDPLTARRDLLTLVSGIEYQLNLIDDKLENRLFVKNYVQLARSEEPLPGGAFRTLNRNTNRFGIGNGFRYAFADWIYAKVSYEFATRLPTPQETFGDAALIVPNLEIQPEISHNPNLGYTIDLRDTRSGEWRMDVNAFLREVDQLIVLLGNDQVFRFQNVFGARSVGIEGSAGWTMKDEWLSIDANATYQSVRNTSSEGTFGEFAGDRIPNQPYLFANGITRFQAQEIGSRNDVFTVVWYLRYTKGFFRTWESAGIRQFKATVPSQVLNTVAVTYVLRARKTSISFTAQAENIGDAQAFDFFGVQRPGRWFGFVVTVDMFTPTEESVSND